MPRKDLTAGQFTVDDSSERKGLITMNDIYNYLIGLGMDEGLAQVVCRRVCAGAGVVSPLLRCCCSCVQSANYRNKSALVPWIGACDATQDSAVSSEYYH